MANAWVEHVRDYAKANGLSYACAMTTEGCKSSYKRPEKAPKKKDQVDIMGMKVDKKLLQQAGKEYVEAGMPEVRIGQLKYGKKERYMQRPFTPPSGETMARERSGMMAEDKPAPAPKNKAKVVAKREKKVTVKKNQPLKIDMKAIRKVEKEDDKYYKSAEYAKDRKVLYSKDKSVTLRPYYDYLKDLPKPTEGRRMVWEAIQAGAFQSNKEVFEFIKALKFKQEREKK
jgi:hypothetical protein